MTVHTSTPASAYAVQALVKVLPRQMSAIQEAVVELMMMDGQLLEDNMPYFTEHGLTVRAATTYINLHHGLQCYHGARYRNPNKTPMAGDIVRVIATGSVRTNLRVYPSARITDNEWQRKEKNVSLCTNPYIPFVSLGLNQDKPISTSQSGGYFGSDAQNKYLYRGTARTTYVAFVDGARAHGAMTFVGYAPTWELMSDKFY